MRASSSRFASPISALDLDLLLNRLHKVLWVTLALTTVLRPAVDHLHH